MIPRNTGFRKDKKKVLIVEGGGMKGSFAGGVLSTMSYLFPVPNYHAVIGVSSGSCSAAYYVTHRKVEDPLIMQTLNIWRYELTGSKLISFFNKLKGKDFLNQEYLVDHLFGEKYKLKSERLDEKKSVPFYIVVSNMKTLKPEYILANSKNILQLLKAAISLPIATSGKKELGDSIYTDGGILDPIPVDTAIKAGYKDITVVLNNPLSFRSDPYDKILSAISYPGYKKVQWAMSNHHHVLYNQSMEIINNPPPGVKIRVIAPDKKLPASLVNTEPNKLNMNVDLGIEAGLRFLRESVNIGRKKISEFMNVVYNRF